MSNIEILYRAIKKAEAEGFNPGRYYMNDNYFRAWFCQGEGRYKQGYKQEYALIFSHDFAKAFWKGAGKKAWKAHLLKMVLMEEPLKYLEQFLEINVVERPHENIT